LNKKYIYISLLLLLPFLLFAQRRPNIGGAGGGFGGLGGGGNSGSSYPNTTGTTETEENFKPDTVRVAYFFATQPSQKLSLKDTLLHSNFHQFTPMRSSRAEYSFLGMIGSAHRPMVFETNLREGFDVGIHCFDLYNVDNNNIKYYQSSRPFSDAKWTVRSIKSDANFDFTYGAQFKNNNYASLEWHRANAASFETSRLNYNFQRNGNRNTNWGFGFGHLGKYSYFASLTTNNFEQTNNGGIVTDTSMLKAGFLGNFTVPTRLSRTLENRYRNQTMQYRHSYVFNNDADVKRKYLIQHIAEYQIFINKNYYNTDKNPTKSDSVFFKNYLKDVRGLRGYFDIRKFENTVSIATQKKRKSEVPDAFEVGAKHRFYTLYYEPLDSSVQHVFLFGKWNTQPTRWLNFNTYAHFGVLPDNAAEYALKADLVLDLQKAGVLEGSFLQQRYQPSFLQTHAYNFQQEVFRNKDFSKIFATNLQVAYRLPRFNFTAAAAYHLLNNYIYFDENLQAIQTNAAVNILQLQIMQDFHLGKLHNENYIALQTSNNKAVQLPAAMGKHSLYLEGRIFRKGAMLARIGADFRYTTNYKSDGYNALINQFYTQTSTEIPLYPALDVFLSTKVMRVKTFLKVENITSSFYKKNIYYLTPFYPMYGTYFRLGVSRTFTD
jgi:Putative porin